MIVVAPGKAAQWVLGAVLVLLYLGTLSCLPFFDPDEGRYTEVPREMLAGGDYVIPHLNGVMYLEKPPLHYWMSALSMRVLGIHEFASRLTSALTGLLGLALAWIMGTAAAGRRTGFAAAAILGTSPLYFGLAHITTLDMTLTFFISLALVSFWMAHKGAGRFWWYGVFAGAALAVLTKGLIGMVAPGAVIFLYLLFARRWLVLKAVPWVTGPLLFFAIALPWHILAARRNPDFLWFYFIREHFLRYVTPEAERMAPFWFFLPILLIGMLPWSGLIPGAVGLWRERNAQDAPNRRDAMIYLLCWAGFIFVFFSASHSKMAPYILPALPPLAVLGGMILSKTEESRPPWMRFSMPAAMALSILLGGLFFAASIGKIPAFSDSSYFSLLLLICSAITVLAAIFGIFAWIRMNRRNALYASLISALALLACILAAGPKFSEGRTTKPFADYLQAHAAPDAKIFGYRFYPQSLPVYLGRPVHLAGGWGELSYGISRLRESDKAGRIMQTWDLKPIWESAEAVYLLMEQSSLSRMESDRLKPGPVVMKRGKLILMVNYEPGRTVAKEPADAKPLS